LYYNITNIIQGSNVRQRIFRISAIAVFLFAFIGLIFSSDIAYAALPDSYISSVADNDLDWWTGENGLDIDALKTTVKGWLLDDAYDFDYLKRNPVTVAVIDSGIALEHELFKGNYYENGAASEDETYGVLLKDADGNPVYKNTVTKGSDDYTASDIADDAENKHGTHVAGIIAILIHELDLEDYIKILPIKASYQKREFVDGRWQYRTNFNAHDVQAAIAFAIEKGADVVNMSFAAGGDESYRVPDAYADKAVFVAAAGNTGRNSDASKTYKYYPAADGNVIGVMNYRVKDGGRELHSSSNYGTSYDLCAPGVGIYSADGDGIDAYRSLDGTSMASPIVAFGAALLTAKNTAQAGENGSRTTVAEVRNEVINAHSATVKRKGDPREFNVFDLNKLVGENEYYARIEAAEGELTQYLGDVRFVKLKLVTAPSTAKGDIKWYMGDVLIGSGSNEISVTPRSSAGTTEVIAVWKPLSLDKEILCSVNIVVKYIDLDAEAIKNFGISVKDEYGGACDNNACMVGEKYRLALTGIENVSPDEITTFMWYIDDEYYAGGEACDFIPQDVASYEVKVKINGVFTQSKTIVAVREADRRQGHILKIASITAGAAIAAVVLIVVAVVAGKSRKIKK